MKSRLIPLVALAFSVSLANASILVQELFDNISSGNATLNGAGNTTTSIGITGTWLTNGSTGIYTANNFNVVGSTLPGLPASDTANGGVWNNTGSYNTSIYATRPLATPIDFGVDRVIYFSVRLNNPGDTSMGVGLASGSGPTDQFVGAGFTWNNAVPLSGGGNIAGNSSYISHGVLDGATQSGVYGIRVFESGNPINTYGLLVGRITINATGDDVIHIKRYAQNAVIDDNLDAIVWSNITTVNSSMVASRLLLWMNGGGSGEMDAIRFGDTWTDVTGVTLIDGQPGLSGAGVAGVTDVSAEASVNLFTSPADVTLHWDEVDQGTGTWTNSNALGNQPVGPITGASISGLEPDKVYFYRFHAVNTAADPDLEAWSEAGTSFTTALTGLDVTDLNSSSFSPIEVELSWSDNFDTETGYTIQRSPAAANTWVTVGTAPANIPFFTDRHSGLTPETAYDYRVIATNTAGNSDPSDVSTVTTLSAAALETKLLVNFNGTLDGTVYTPAESELDVTGSFKANGVPNVSAGVATLNPGNEGGPDGFDINPASLGDLRNQNWVAETVVTYQSSGNLTTTPVLIDVQGDTNLRLRAENDPSVLQMFYWNGNSGQQRLTALPPNGVKVHLALAWNASTTTLTGYINGVPFDSVSGGPFATPDTTTLSFGYFGRTSFEGRGIDGILDAVAFQTGTAAFNPATDFLILPETDTFASWISGFPVGGLDGFGEDADSDGLSSGVEAFMGTNPSVSNASAVTQVSTNGTVTTFTHPQADPALGDVTGSYEWSSDLGTWYAGDGVDGPGGGTTVSIPTAPPVSGISTITATSSVPLSRLFIRIAAEN
ncbi:MAG: hypothetical protein V4689_09865 [Verrucomicrobiota bacterium]